MTVPRTPLFLLPGLFLMYVGCSSPSPAKSGSTDAGGVASGRIVSACTDCSAGEFCVDVGFSGGPCEGSGSGSSGSDCPPGTSLDGDCCQPDPSDTYYCYPNPTGCASPITCECGANVVIDACDGQVLDDVECAQITGGLSCQQNHD